MQAQAYGTEVMYFALSSDSIFPHYQCISHHREPPLHSELPECLDQENFATISIFTLIEWMYSDEVFCFIFCSPGIRKGTFT